MITIKNDPALLDQCWTWLILASVGGEFLEEDSICGAGTSAVLFSFRPPRAIADQRLASEVLLNRPRNSRIQLWLKNSLALDINTSIATRLIQILELIVDGDCVKLEFKPHLASIVTAARSTTPSSPCFFLPSSPSPSPSPRKGLSKLNPNAGIFSQTIGENEVYEDEVEIIV
jgi:hypothetical protein